jgi:hypothetical protein
VGCRERIKGETSKFLGGFILAKLCKNKDLSKLGEKNGEKKLLKKGLKFCKQTVRILSKKL